MQHAMFNRATSRVADTTDVSGRATAESIKHGFCAKKQSSLWRICGLTIFESVVSVCVLASLAPMPAQAQGSPPESTATVPRVGMLGEFKKKSLVGSWLETVTFPPETGRPKLKSLVRFHDDGTVVSSDQGSVTLDPPSVSSDGAGAWTQLDWHRFAYTQLELFSDLKGNLTGFLKVRGIYTLSGSGDAYTDTSYYQVLDTDRNPLVPSVAGYVNNVGERIRVELPPPQP